MNNRNGNSWSTSQWKPRVFPTSNNKKKTAKWNTEHFLQVSNEGFQLQVVFNNNIERRLIINWTASTENLSVFRWKGVKIPTKINSELSTIV